MPHAVSSAVSTVVHTDVLVVRIDNPPVNALSPEVIAGLSRAIDEACANTAIRAVVVLAAGRTFIAGADIKGLEGLAWGDMSGAPDMHDVLRQIEDCPKPVVMALHGTALGGGLEVAMAGHFRVAVPSAQVGQPEVNLGVIPGAEGTQRLPRLVGVEKALDMCISGRPISAGDARQAGLVDALIEGDLEAGAIAFARTRIGGGAPPRTRERTDRLPPREALPTMLTAGRALAAKVRKRLEAPLKVVDAIEAAATLPFDEGCRRERALFFECAASEQCKALIHAFFAERAASKVPGITKDTPVAAVSTVGIVGAGTMGGGIAMACANAGIRVRLADTDAIRVEHGLDLVKKNYDVSVTRGRFTPEAVQERLARIEPQAGLGGFDGVDAVIEAAFENLALKTQIFGELSATTRPGILLGTNTSTLDIDRIAAATSRADTVVGLHFFSPANVMRLVEIVRGAATSAETVATALALAKRLGKVGVVVGNGFGFVGNRMMLPYMYEAQFLVEDGSTPGEVDAALTAFGMAMGIFAVDDMAGLDVAWRVRQEHPPFPDPSMRQPLVVDRLCEMGRFGQKTGAGWYTYADGRTPAPDPEVQSLIVRLTAEAGLTRRTVAADEITERLVYTLINEGARLLEDGIALRASDIDVIYVNGYGFPAFRGGPMFYADRVGLARVHDRIATLHRELGPRWAPAPLLSRLAAEGSTFRAFDAAHAG